MAVRDLQAEDAPSPVSVRSIFERAGCYLMARSLLPAALVERARAAASALERGEFAPERAPWRVLRGEQAGSLIKIDQPHLSDPALLELMVHPALGELAAEATGARHIQAWATQLLIKPPGGGSAGCVGWHTDQQYWPWFRGSVFTMWIALEDVLPESGPVRLLVGSHRWPEGSFMGNALNHHLDAQESVWRARVGGNDGPAFRVVQLTLPAGGVAIFDAKLLHCSGPNTSSSTRRGVAIHLCCERTEKVAAQDEYGFVKRLAQRDQCPVIFGAS